VPQTSDVKISWNGATKGTAESVMLGVNFEKAIKNVQEFISYRNLYHNERAYYCRVTFQLTFMRHNMQELVDIIKLAAELDVDRVKGHHLWAHFDEIKAHSMKSSDASINEWNEYVKQAHDTVELYKRPNGEKVLLENIYPLEKNEGMGVPDNYTCPFLEKEIWVSATGKISPCCAPDKLRDSLGDFGNIQSQSISKVIAGNDYQDLVSNYKSHPLCKTCNMRKP
jgi:MoaA/NifB/PqqE/SkfB family radical SAM enzyme